MISLAPCNFNDQGAHDFIIEDVCIANETEQRKYLDKIEYGFYETYLYYNYE